MVKKIIVSLCLALSVMATFGQPCSASSKNKFGSTTWEFLCTKTWGEQAQNVINSHFGEPNIDNGYKLNACKAKIRILQQGDYFSLKIKWKNKALLCEELKKCIDELNAIDIN